MTEILKAAAALVVLELRQAWVRRAARAARAEAARAHATSATASTLVTCGLCGARVPADGTAMSEHMRRVHS